MGGGGGGGGVGVAIGVAIGDGIRPPPPPPHALSASARMVSRHTGRRTLFTSGMAGFLLRPVMSGHHNRLFRRNGKSFAAGGRRFIPQWTSAGARFRLHRKEATTVKK